jgi:hypothetical protein
MRLPSEDRDQETMKSKFMCFRLTVRESLVRVGSAAASGLLWLCSPAAATFKFHCSCNSLPQALCPLQALPTIIMIEDSRGRRAPPALPRAAAQPQLLHYYIQFFISTSLLHSHYLLLLLYYCSITASLLHFNIHYYIITASLLQHDHDVNIMINSLLHHYFKTLRHYCIHHYYIITTSLPHH